MQIRQCFFNDNEACPRMLMRKCLLAMLTLMLVILMLILMLLNLNTGYTDTDADLCIRIMSLCWISVSIALFHNMPVACYNWIHFIFRCIVKGNKTCLHIILIFWLIDSVTLPVKVFHSVVEILNYHNTKWKYSYFGLKYFRCLYCHPLHFFVH